MANDPTNPGFFGRPLIPNQPAPEPPGFDIVRQMLMSRMFQQMQNPYGMNPSFLQGGGQFQGPFSQVGQQFNPYSAGLPGQGGGGFNPMSQGMPQGMPGGMGGSVGGGMGQPPMQMQQGQGGPPQGQGGSIANLLQMLPMILGQHGGQMSTQPVPNQTMGHDATDMNPMMFQGGGGGGPAPAFPSPSLRGYDAVSENFTQQPSNQWSHAGPPNNNTGLNTIGDLTGGQVNAHKPGGWLGGGGAANNQVGPIAPINVPNPRTIGSQFGGRGGGTPLGHQYSPTGFAFGGSIGNWNQGPQHTFFRPGQGMVGPGYGNAPQVSTPYPTAPPPNGLVTTDATPLASSPMGGPSISYDAVPRGTTNYGRIIPMLAALQAGGPPRMPGAGRMPGFRPPRPSGGGFRAPKPPGRVMGPPKGVGI